jgi:transcriptional regulator with XRE-family HTH domain
VGAELGERIRWFRERAQESQERFAVAIGATGSAVSRWERGEVDPQLGFILKMCEHWGVSPTELLTPVGIAQPAGESEAFKVFEASEYGEIAKRRGWLAALRTMRFPVEPTTQLYCDMVHALMAEAQRRKP